MLPLFYIRRCIVYKFPEVMREKSSTEDRLGRMAGPFACPLLRKLKSSPLVVVTKKEPYSSLVLPVGSFGQ